MGRGERTETGTHAVTAVAAAAMFYLQGGYGKGNDGRTIGGGGNPARCTCLPGGKDREQDEAPHK